MQQIWSDTDLIYWTRSEINNTYGRETNFSLGYEYVRKDDSALSLLAAVCDVIGN
jgi:hypothetical protein